jgi:hypothetical protein
MTGLENNVYVNAGFGDGVAVGNYAELQKALEAGSSANPATMGTGGNTLQFESLETQLVSALAEKPEDFKLMRMQPRVNVGSTVHQYTQENDSGNYEGVATAELGDPIASNSEYSRNTRNIKYYQTKREVSLQANRLNPIVGGVSAEANEERHGTHVLLKATEYYSFHGDEAVSPDLPSGYPQMIRDEAPQNVFDFTGKRLIDAGMEQAFEEAIRGVWEQGGDITDTFFPGILAQDWMELIRDRLRYNEGSKKAGVQLTTYQSMYGNDIMISGRAGVDKMYRVKGIPTPSNSAITQKPNAPTFALAAQVKTGGTGFVVATAGTYRYTVYAVSREGLISEAAAPANIAVASGEEVKVTVTPAGAKPGTGFIVCRGKKDVTTGNDLREVLRVGFTNALTTPIATDYLDQNDELPGTAEMLLLTNDSVVPTFQWDSFMDLSRLDLGRTRASTPFLMLWYGAPDLKIAKRNAIIKNVGHRDVDGWFA